MTLAVARSQKALREVCEPWAAAGESLGLVPTMGALHEGHLALLEAALLRSKRSAVTIFVNSKQFAPHEDLGRYPRDEKNDLAMLEKAGAHVVYIPDPSEIYPAGFATTVSVAGPAKAGLEDKFRPHFFDGVATVVAKLFIQSRADQAFFGEKDYQQLLVVRQMARDLNLAIEVVGVPTVREDDGLAKSSRNRFLSKHERHQATAIIRSLHQAAEKIANGADLQAATKSAARSLNTLGFKVDYVTARNADTLAVPLSRDEPLRILAAAWLGKTRLIDNIAV